MVRAGEEGSFLEDVLRRIADFTEHQEELKSRVTGAMAYPFFLVIFGVGIVAAMRSVVTTSAAPAQAPPEAARPRGRTLIV